MTWHVLIDGEQKGPFEADTVVRMIGRNEVTADTMIWSAGISDWTRAIEVPDFADSFDGTAAAQPLRYGAEVADDEGGAPGRLKFGQVFADAFGGLFARLGNTLLITLIYAAILVAVSIPYYANVAPKIQTIMQGTDEFDVAAFGLGDLGAYLLMVVVSVAMFGGLCTATIGMVRREEVPVTSLFTGLPRILTLIGFAILYFVLSALATVALVLPGFFVFVSLLLGMYIIMDRGVGVFAGIKSSFRATLRLGWFRMFGLLLLMFIAVFAIFLVFGIIAAVWLAAQGGLIDEALDGAAVTMSMTYYVIQTAISSVFTVVFAALLAAAYKQAEPHLDAAN